MLDTRPCVSVRSLVDERVEKNLWVLVKALPAHTGERAFSVQVMTRSQVLSLRPAVWRDLRHVY